MALYGIFMEYSNKVTIINKYDNIVIKQNIYNSKIIKVTSLYPQ